MTKSRSTLLALVASAITFEASACAANGADSSERASAPPPPTFAEAGTAADTGNDVVIDPDGSIAVNGTLVALTDPSYAALPVALKVVVLDAVGVRQETSSAPDGRFSFFNVRAPYDVSVLTSGGNSFGPQIRLGISTRSPKIAVPTKYTPPTQGKGTISLTARVPSCPEAQCYLQASSASAHGAGQFNTFYLAGTTSVPLSIEHTWSGHASPEDVTVQVLAATATRSAFWHSELSTVLTPGASASFAPVLVSTPVFGSFTAAAQDSSFSTEWTRDLSIYVLLPGVRSGFLVGEASSSSLVANVPNIAGAAILALDTLQVLDRTPLPNRVSRFAQSATGDAQTGGLPLSTTSSTLTFLGPPENVQPAANGTLQAKTGSLSWQTPESQTASIELDSSTGVVLSLVTNEKSIALDRLYKLGIPELSAGDHYLTLATCPAVVLDDLVSDDAKKRRELFQAAAPRTSSMFRFSVLP